MHSSVKGLGARILNLLLFGYDVVNYTYLPINYIYFIRGIFINNNFVLHSEYLFEYFGKYLNTNLNNYSIFFFIKFTAFNNNFY